MQLDQSVAHIDTRTIREAVRHDLETYAVPQCVESLDECHNWIVLTWVDGGFHPWTVLVVDQGDDEEDDAPPPLFLDMRRTGRHTHMSVHPLSGDQLDELAGTWQCESKPWSILRQALPDSIVKPKTVQDPIYAEDELECSLLSIEEILINFSEQFGDYHMLRNNCQRHAVELQEALGATKTANLTRSMCITQRFWD